MLCIDCFKRHYVYYEDEDADKEPKFPYDEEIEEEYFRDPYRRCSLKWRDDDLIKKYEKDWAAWDEIQYHRRKHENGVRKCPVCKR
jgi:hypothetical protein